MVERCCLHQYSAFIVSESLELIICSSRHLVCAQGLRLKRPVRSSSWNTDFSEKMRERGHRHLKLLNRHDVFSLRVYSITRTRVSFCVLMSLFHVVTPYCGVGTASRWERRTQAREATAAQWQMPTRHHIAIETDCHRNDETAGIEGELYYTI